MRIGILLLLLLTALPLFAGDVYKWTSADGEVIYSERYHPDAERIKVTGKKKTSAVSLTDQDEEAAAEAAAAGDYASFEIVQPADDETVRNADGSVPVGLSLSPTLASGHIIHLYVDGAKLDSDITRTQLILQQLSRGTHTLQAKIVDSQGEPLKDSNSVTFHLRQAAVSTP
ncbi:MAG: DUF4124 domain-containing protein [Candidatus Thiodiazotropha sp. (ex Epidulcina cf. delphinae)]|nr:DUF4124 domain-containing protein [Candidatus Thiodiazotropha sp. (ex Epidulcina cf. delphinae)]